MTTIDQLLPTNIRQALLAANAPTFANPFATMADVAGSGPSIYTTDGTLTSTRTVTNAGFNLNLIGTGKLIIGASTSVYGPSKVEIIGRLAVSDGVFAMSPAGVIYGTTVGGPSEYSVAASSNIPLGLSTSGTGYITFFTGAAERMRISATGGVTITNLAGTGSRLVLADSTGLLTVGAGAFIPTSSIDFTGCIPVINATAVIGCSPLLLSGGSAVTDNIIYRSTSGTGTTTALGHQFTGGTNGGTTIASLYNDSQFILTSPGATLTRNPNSLGLFRVIQGTSGTEVTVDIGKVGSATGGIWMTNTTNTSSNYTLSGGFNSTNLNAGTTLILATANITKASFSATQIILTPGISTSAANTPFTYTAPANTTQTAGLEALGVNFNLSATLQHAGNTLIATQRAFIIQAPTYSFQTAGGVITDAVTFAVTGPPIAGTNATITRSWAARLLGNVAIGGLMHVGDITGTTAPNSTLHVGGSLAVAWVLKTGAYTATISDSVIDVDATTAAVTITLPTAVGITGRIYYIKKIDASVNAVTIDAAGTELIDGQLTRIIAVQYNTVTLISNGTNWGVY